MSDETANVINETPLDDVDSMVLPKAETFNPDDRRDYVDRVVRHRCGDVLTDLDLAMLAVPVVPGEIAERVEDVLEAISERVHRLEARLQARLDA
jgi:hypothetical protein